MQDRLSIVAAIALMAVVGLLVLRRPPPANALPRATRATHATPRPRRDPEPAASSPEGELRQTIEWETVAAGWLDAAVVTCRVPEVPAPNLAVIHYEPDALEGGFLHSSSPARNGDVFSFYVPPGPGRARLIVEAVGTWDITWPDVGVGAVEPCASITRRADTSTVQGRVRAHGLCEDLEVSGCGGRSEVDDDGSYVLLDVAPGSCELRVQNRRLNGPSACARPTSIEVVVGESIEDQELSIDCDRDVDPCPDSDTHQFCEYTVVQVVGMGAVIKSQLAVATHPPLEEVVAKLTTLVRNARRECEANAPTFDRMANDVGLDLTTPEGAPDAAP